MDIPAFLLTAGQGTRLRPWTETKAKPCLPFLGVPLVGFGYFLCRQAGFQNFVFNMHHLAESTRTLLKKELPSSQSFLFSDESEKLLGSGGALWKARDLLSSAEAFLVANGDEVLLPKHQTLFSDFVKKFLTDPPLAQLLVTDHPELLKTLKPVWIDDNNLVVGFGMDRPKTSCRPVHYTGYKMFSKKIFDWLPEGESNIFYEVLTEAIAKGERVQVFHEKEMLWFETGTIPNYFSAQKQCAQILKAPTPELLPYQDILEQLLKFYNLDPKDFHFRSTPEADVFFHNTVDIPQAITLKGFVSLAAGTRVGKDVLLENVVTEKNYAVLDRQNLINTIGMTLT